MGRLKNTGLCAGTKGNPQQSLEQENFAQKNSDTSSAMPNYDKATIGDDKFLKYSLDMTSEKGRDKAIAYEQGLGFNKTNYLALKEQIISKVNGGTAKLVKTHDTEFGPRYTFEIPVKGPNSSTKIVVVVYQVDNDIGIPRLITNYLKKKGGD